MRLRRTGAARPAEGGHGAAGCALWLLHFALPLSPQIQAKFTELGFGDNDVIVRTPDEVLALPTRARLQLSRWYRKGLKALFQVPGEVLRKGIPAGSLRDWKVLAQIGKDADAGESGGEGSDDGSDSENEGVRMPIIPSKPTMAQLLEAGGARRNSQKHYQQHNFVNKIAPTTGHAAHKPTM